MNICIFTKVKLHPDTVKLAHMHSQQWRLCTLPRWQVLNANSSSKAEGFLPPLKRDCAEKGRPGTLHPPLRSHYRSASLLVLFLTTHMCVLCSGALWVRRLKGQSAWFSLIPVCVVLLSRVRSFYANFKFEKRAQMIRDTQYKIKSLSFHFYFELTVLRIIFESLLY